MTAQLRLSAAARRRGVALVLALCLVLGLLAGISPALGLAVSCAIVFAAATMANTMVGVALFTFISFLDVLSTTSATSYTKLAGLLLFGSWYATSLRRAHTRAAAMPRIGRGFALATIGLLLWSALSVSWADFPGDATSATSRYLLNMLLIPIVFVAVRRREHLLWVVGAFVAGAVLSSIWGFAVASTVEPGRLAGAVGDANEQAAVLVAAIPMALALMRSLRHRPLGQLLCLVAALICLAGAIQTLSRGGLIALAAVMVAAVCWGGRWRRAAATLLALTAVGVVTYFAVLAPVASTQRVTMSDSSGRTDLWTVGVRMFEANPLTGTGSGNFPDSSRRYLNVPGTISRADLIVDDPHVAHNIYLELASDLGLPGLLLLLTIMLSCLRAALRGARDFGRHGDIDMELMSRCLALALVAMIVADFFLSGEFSKQLWLIFALCAVTPGLSRIASGVQMAGPSAPRALEPPAVEAAGLNGGPAPVLTR